MHNQLLAPTRFPRGLAGRLVGMMPSPEGDQERLFFQPVKEDRGWYFVEYRPPISGYQFATLQLVILEKAKRLEEIAASMEAELVIWLERYPIPIMASAFDDSGDLVRLEKNQGCNHVIGYIDEQKHKVVHEWRLLTNEELPRDALDTSYLRKIYSQIPFKTKQQLREEAQQKAKHLRLGWWIVFVWAVVVPAGVAILEWWSDWLGVVVLLYSLYKAIEKALRLTGKWPKSKAEIEKEAEEARMRHHHYHCECNPAGFERLKVENFERWAREDIRQEALSLKRSSKHDANDD
ncbi:MAG: hypothetical protein EPO61_10330 [Nitrospirae bacterium]|nr:MAG: hypothetical protein EPO61_10330 [Nitrospirota bacterium]